MTLALPVIMTAFITLAAMPASAQELTGPCPVGKMVTDRAGKSGKVISTDAVSCYVQMPEGRKYYLSWMLRLAGTPEFSPSDIARITPKKYQCYGNGNYLFMDLVIKDGSNYTDGGGKPGKYRYDPKTQLITFQSGSFQGNYSKYMGKRGIGLASKPVTFWATMCN